MITVVNSLKDENENKRTQLNNLMNTKGLQDTKINNLNTDVKILSSNIDDLRRKNDSYVRDMSETKSKMENNNFKISRENDVINKEIQDQIYIYRK